METIAIEELGERLTEFIERARRGERFVLTEKGEAIAELTPLDRQRLTLEQLVREGKLQWSGGKPKGTRGITVRGEPMSETVLKARG